MTSAADEMFASLTLFDIGEFKGVAPTKMSADNPPMIRTWGDRLFKRLVCVPLKEILPEN